MMRKSLLILVAICFSTTAFAQGAPKIVNKPPPDRAKPKEPTAYKLVATVRGTKLWAGDCMGVELLKGRQKRQSKQRSPVRRSDREQPRPMQPASASASPSVPECACADLQTRQHQSDARNPAHSTSAPRTGVP
jgi:hypothetical protein